MDSFIYVKRDLLLDIQFNFNTHMPYMNEAIQNAKPLYVIAISLESTTFMKVDVKYNPIPTILDIPITAKISLCESNKPILFECIYNLRYKS